jgi:hypothetical protein
LLKPKLPELEAINDYSKKYYHDQNPNGWATEPINDAALQAYSKRAMAFACGV